MTPLASGWPSGWRVAGGLLASAAASVVASLLLVLWPEITRGFGRSSFRVEYAVIGVALLLAYHILVVTPGVLLLRWAWGGLSLSRCLLAFTALGAMAPFVGELLVALVLDGGRGWLRTLRRVAWVPLEIPGVFAGAALVGLLAGLAYQAVARGPAGRATPP